MASRVNPLMTAVVSLTTHSGRPKGTTQWEFSAEPMISGVSRTTTIELVCVQQTNQIPDDVTYIDVPVE